MAGKWTMILMLPLVAAVIVSCGQAAPLKVSDAAPPWAGIPGIDDKEHALADCKKAKAVVLVFTCNHCPVAVAYEDRLVALQKDYASKGVQVVAVCVNDLDQDRLPAMKKRAAEKKFNFPYIYDETQKIGRDYGATCTPHVFLLDQKRKIAYMGAIDDHNNPKKVEEHYLRDAIDAVLAGKEPPKPVTQQRGCGIKWKP
ncbi:MAG: thioredoxin family protein [Pirellulales bacterium]|nr:thioredoxin family protein [Pirellulales bacterium]